MAVLVCSLFAGWSVVLSHMAGMVLNQSIVETGQQICRCQLFQTGEKRRAEFEVVEEADSASEKPGSQSQS